MHLRGASLALSHRLSTPAPQILQLLSAWLRTTLGWMSPRHSPPTQDDSHHLLTTLHFLHTEAFSLPDSQSSDTSPSALTSSAPIPLSLASNGIGPTGSVPVPQDIWMTCAPGGLLLADARSPPQKPSNCPLVQAMLDALLSAGLVALHPGLPNAEVFVKRKSATKAALIINMRTLNANCPTPPPKFRLPTLLEIGATLRFHRLHSSAACIATIDLANCFWSILLPPSNIGCVRIGTPSHTYTLLRIPFGWSHAPGLAQQVVQRYLAPYPPLPLPHTDSMQYLDDAAFISSSPQALTSAVDLAVSSLQSAGFLISPKSELDPRPSATFIGKRIDASLGTISTLPAYLAGVVLQWLSLATGPLTTRCLSRLLGKLIWLAQPARRILPFLAGPYAALHHGPKRCSHTSPNITRSLLEALAMAFPAWRSDILLPSPGPSAPRFFADAARSPWGTFYVGIWEHSMGSRFFPCPPWVLTQQAAELFAAYRALTLAAFRHRSSFHLLLDNHAAIHSLLRGRARSPLIPQNRILRRISHVLHWSGLTAAVHYVPSQLNPADPLSRWWTFPSSEPLLTRTWGLGLSHLSRPLPPSWGLLVGLQRTI